VETRDIKHKVYLGEHVDGGPSTPPVHVNLALNASAFKNMSVEIMPVESTHVLKL
jgi:hypothetical protein